MQLTALISHSIYYLTLKVELLTMLLKDIPHQKLKGSGWNTVRYIENNPVKARLCKEPSDWPFSSAWFRKHGRKNK
jgi:hypothetical protein